MPFLLSKPEIQSGIGSSTLLQGRGEMTMGGGGGAQTATSRFLAGPICTRWCTSVEYSQIISRGYCIGELQGWYWPGCPTTVLEFGPGWWALVRERDEWPYRITINFTWWSLHFLFKNILKKKKNYMLLIIVWRSSWAFSHSWVVNGWLNFLVNLIMLSWLLLWNSVIECWRFAWGLSRRSFSECNWQRGFEDDAIYALVKVDWVGLECWLGLILMLYVFVVC